MKVASAHEVSSSSFSLACRRHRIDANYNGKRMHITASSSSVADPSTGPAATAPASAADIAGSIAAPAADSSMVTLSPQGLQLAASTSPVDPLALPDLDGLAKIDQALAGVPDTNAAQARAQAQLARERDKQKFSFSMLDVDAFRNVRDKIRAKLQQRPEAPAAKQQADEDAARQRIKDSQPL
jgi:hypothetical protein